MGKRFRWQRRYTRGNSEDILRKWEGLGERIGDAIFGTPPRPRPAFGRVVSRVKGREVWEWRGELIVYLKRGVDYETR